MLVAAAALTSNDGRRAIAALDSATPYERSAGPWLQYLRGLARMATREYALAVDEFRMVIARPGNQPTNIVHTLSHLQLARAASSGTTWNPMIATFLGWLGSVGLMRVAIASSTSLSLIAPTPL